MMNIKIVSVLFVLFAGHLSAEESSVWAGVGITRMDGMESNMLLVPEKDMGIISGNMSLTRLFGNGLAISGSVPFIRKNIGEMEVSGLGDPTLGARITGNDGSLFASLTVPAGSEGISGDDTITQLGIHWVDSSSKFISGGITWIRGWNTGTDGFLYSIGIGTELSPSMMMRGTLSGLSVIDGAHTQSIGLSAIFRTSPSSGLEFKTETELGGSDGWSMGLTHYWKL